MTAETSKTYKSTGEKTAKKREVKPPAIQNVSAPESALPATDLQRAVVDPRTARPPEILALQRTYGNEAVQRLLINHNLQAKLTVGAANDSYEQEADRVAAQVMSAPAHTPDVQRQSEEEEEIQTKPLAATITPLIQRQAIPEEEEELLQGKSISGSETFSPGADFESRLAATHGSGRPLPKSAREFMEERFGADFSGVRLHTGSESAQLNREISAQAFTRGQDVYLGEGKESVESGTEQQLLAHELTHVMQQTGASRQAMQPGQMSSNSTSSISIQSASPIPRVQRISISSYEFTKKSNGDFRNIDIVSWLQKRESACYAGTRERLLEACEAWLKDPPKDSTPELRVLVERIKEEVIIELKDMAARATTTTGAARTSVATVSSSVASVTSASRAGSVASASATSSAHKTATPSTTAASGAAATAASSSASGALTELKDGPELTGQIRELLKIKGVLRYVKVPNDKKTMVTTPFSEYPTGCVTGLAGSELALSVGAIQYGASLPEMMRDQDFLRMTAYELMETQGGGSYAHTVNIVLMNEGQAAITLLHEMGHFKQNEEAANVATANQVILEYHNIVLHENLGHRLKHEPPRVFYDRSHLKRLPVGRNWDTMVAEEARHPQNSKLLGEIREALEGRDPPIWETIKTNVPKEYYAAKGSS